MVQDFNNLSSLIFRKTCFCQNALVLSDGGGRKKRETERTTKYNDKKRTYVFTGLIIRGNTRTKKF